MAHPNVDLMNRFFAAIIAQDRPVILECLHDDVVMHLPGHNSVSGTYKGKEQFVSTLSKAEQVSGGLQRELHEIMASDSHVAVLVNVKANRDGQALSWSGCNIWHVRDGKLAEVWLLSDDQDTTDIALA